MSWTPPQNHRTGKCWTDSLDHDGQLLQGPYLVHVSPPVVTVKHGNCEFFTAPDSGKIGETSIVSPHKRNPGYKTSYDKDGGPFPDFFPPIIPFMHLACQSREGNDSRRRHYRYRRCVWLPGGRRRRIIPMVVT
jgi:hypothetical protein